MGRAADAVADYEWAVEHGADDGNDAQPAKTALGVALSNAAVGLEKEGDLAGAIGLLDRAIALAPSATRHFNRATLLMKSEDKVRAARAPAPPVARAHAPAASRVCLRV